MNINNLSVGMVIKNYKELCELLGIKQKTSNSKNAQMKELERYVNFEKVGRSFEIKEIYSEPKSKEDKRSQGNNTISNTSDLELLLLDLLSRNKEGTLIMTDRLLFFLLHMTNKNYSRYYGNLRPLLAENLFINLDEINDYYDNVDAQLSRNLKKVFKILVDKKLIVHSEIMMLLKIDAKAERNSLGNIKITKHTEIDERGIEKEIFIPSKVKTEIHHVQANDKEIKKVLKIEREVLLDMGYRDDVKKNILFQHGKMNQFYDRVNERLLDEMGVIRTYKANKILFNQEHVEDEKMYILEELEKGILQLKVNTSIQQRVIENTVKRIHRAELKMIDIIKLEDELYELSNKNRIALREDYIDNVDVLNTFLIDVFNEKERYIMLNERKQLKEQKEKENNLNNIEIDNLL